MLLLIFLNPFCLGEQVVCSFWREVKSAGGNNNVQFSGGPKIISHRAHSDVEIGKIILKFAQNHHFLLQCS